MGRFDKRVVLISGTGGGQGRVAAMSFAREGALVLGTDVNAERSAETTRLVREAGGTMESVEPVDLGVPEEAERWVRRAEETWGRVDVLYNNAAGVRLAGFGEGTLAEWDFTIRNELTIAFVASQAVWPVMKRQGHGVIVSVASVAGHREMGHFPCAAHGVANAGIIALARTMAVAGAPHGIRSVSVSPGWVDNPLAPSRNSPDVALRTIHQRSLPGIPLGRAADMQEVVNAALFLASDDASYITGTDLVVDGGMTGSIHADPVPDDAAGDAA